MLQSVVTKFIPNFFSLVKLLRVDRSLTESFKFSVRKQFQFNSKLVRTIVKDVLGRGLGIICIFPNVNKNVLLGTF